MLQAVSLTKAHKYVVACLRSKVFPYVSGSPACGKSQMIAAVAKEFKLKVIDIRLAQEDPTCINGFPDVSNGRSSYLPPVRFPLEGLDEVPQGYNGWLILFDELPSAPESVQAACYKIILDRMIGEHKIHSKCVMCGAGNLITDDAIVEEMGTALKSRMAHIKVQGNPKEYLKLITSKEFNFDSRIVAYLSYAQDKINTFDKFQRNSSDETFASQRTWEFVDNILKANCPQQDEPIDPEWDTLLCGVIGSTALEFTQFTYAFKDLPRYDEILHNPTKATVPDQPAVMWLLVSMLISSVTIKDIDPIITYASRLPKEFQYIFLRMVTNKSDKFLDVQSVIDLWDSIADMMTA